MSVAHLEELVPGRVTVDVVHWRDAAQGCSRCAGAARYYVTPYFAPTKRVCPMCCVELNRLYDEHGWPQEGRCDIPVGDRPM